MVNVADIDGGITTDQILSRHRHSAEQLGGLVNVVVFRCCLNVERRDGPKLREGRCLLAALTSHWSGAGKHASDGSKVACWA